MTNLWLFTAFVIGAIFGSFICCQVRRVIVREKLRGFKKFKQKPSHCEHCNRRLHWWEMIPVLSWLFLRGKCRSCNATIGLVELLAELGLGLVFALATRHFIPELTTAMAIIPQIFAIPAYFLFLTLSCGLFAIFIFDFLTGEMPTRLLTFCIICAILFIGLEWAAAWDGGTFFWGLPLLMLASAAVLSGFYFVLSITPARTSGKIVGDGDWLVALPIAIVLAHPLLAITNLFLANIIGAIIATPFLITKKWRATTRIPFAPLLIVAFFITFFARPFIFEMFMLI
ncbi:prepilin peptidase [Candidatus Saccharibacteria bacterium]|nr:prepilin peptidase [Candidatus Saccharibacteria bacterium]